MSSVAYVQDSEKYFVRQLRCLLQIRVEFRSRLLLQRSSLWLRGVRQLHAQTSSRRNHYRILRWSHGCSPKGYGAWLMIRTMSTLIHIELWYLSLLWFVSSLWLEEHHSRSQASLCSSHPTISGQSCNFKIIDLTTSLSASTTHPISMHILCKDRATLALSCKTNQSCTWRIQELMFQRKVWAGLSTKQNWIHFRHQN